MESKAYKENISTRDMGIDLLKIKNLSNLIGKYIEE